MNQREVLYLTGGLVAGLAAGVLIARSVFKAEFERRADEEIESVKEHYRYIRKEGLELPVSVGEYDKVLEELDYSQSGVVDKRVLFGSDVPRIPAREAPKGGTKTFVLDADYKEVTEFPPDFEEYAMVRDESGPYLISVEEFMDDNQHYDKISLDYYAEDDVVADQSDRPYDDHEEVLGVEWPSKFGFGSDDKNLVYVRNDSLDVDFEIRMDERSYSEVALGIKAPREQIGKFKEDD